MAKEKKRKGGAAQQLMGVRSFTQYGIQTNKGELAFFQVTPTNISVLSGANIEIKIFHLMMVLSAVPDIEIICMDSSECFDENKASLKERLREEQNPSIRTLLSADISHLDSIQVEMATARQFLFAARFKDSKNKAVFENVNRIEKTIAEQGFEVRRLRKPDIKRFLAIYFGANVIGDHMPDVDGEQYLEDDYEAENV